ncbi:MAG: hypothetical protein IJN43_08965 [Ruminococcus sp.]|nr:hypothetical protein [Ruminococcus sp.]
MNEITIWNYDSMAVRTIEMDGEPWFVGKDVATALGYVKTENAIAAHVDEEDKTTTLIQGTGSNYKSQTVLINESGVYSLIFGSKLDSAKKFKRWVTSEVLPAIRQKGTYSIPTLQAKLLVEHDEKLQEISAQIQQNEKKLERIRITFSASRFDWKADCDRILTAIAVKRYNNPDRSWEIQREAFKLLEGRAGCRLQKRLENLRIRMFWDRIPNEEIDKKTKLDIIAADKRLTEIYINIIREMAIKYDV